MGGPREGPARKLGWGGVAEQLQEGHQSPLGSSRGLFARVGQGKVLSPSDKHRGTSAPALRATGPDPVPDHTQNKRQTTASASAALPPPTSALHPCSWFPSAGLAAWGLGQDSPDHRAFALAGPLLPITQISAWRSPPQTDLLGQRVSCPPKHVTLQA